MAAVTICSDFGAHKIKSVTISIVSPSICHEVMFLKVEEESKKVGLKLNIQKTKIMALSPITSLQIEVLISEIQLKTVFAGAVEVAMTRGNQRELARLKNMKKQSNSVKGKRRDDRLSAAAHKQRDSEIMPQKQKKANEKKEEPK